MSRLPYGRDGPPQLRFLVGGSDPDVHDATRQWFHHYFYPQNGEPWLSCAFSRGGYVVREHKVGDFFITPDAADVFCYPRPGVEDGEIQQAFLYPILPLVLNLRGLDAIHGGAVQVGSSAVAFSGVSGGGKSTLLAYLYSAGYPLLSDDYIPLQSHPEGVRVCLGPSSIRLWPDAVRALERLGFPPDAQPRRQEPDQGAGANPAPLKRIYFLEASAAGAGTRITPLSGSEAFMRLVGQAYRLNIHDQVMLRRQADLFSQIAAAGQVRVLRIERGLHLLPEAATQILLDSQE
jgi:hypothetical protein